MGSKEIRNMLNNRKKIAGFTISAPEPEKEQPAQNRFSRIVDKLRNPVNYSKIADDSLKTVEKHLDASNLYTKRTRKGHVHYLDKTSNKTLFVDNGQLITMRKNGLSNDSVAVALELAQGRFGSTLNIKGSKKFKEMVVNVVAERGMDVHFVDKKMNEALQKRLQELQTSKEQQHDTSRDSAFTIAGAEVEHGKESSRDDPLYDDDEENTTAYEANYSDSERDSTAAQEEPTSLKLEGQIVKHGQAPYLNNEDNSASYYVTLRDNDGQEKTHWGIGLKEALKGFQRGQKVSLELKETRHVTVRVRDEQGNLSPRNATRNVWEATRLDGPQPTKSADPLKANTAKNSHAVNKADPGPDLS